VKIRSKLLLLEGSISLILLTALIFSVFAFINIFSLNEIYETSLSEKNRLRNFRLLVEDILYFPNQSSENFFYVIERWENVYFSSDKEIISLTKGASKDELIEQYNIFNQDWIDLSNKNILVDSEQHFHEYYNQGKKNISFFAYMNEMYKGKAPEYINELIFLVDELTRLEDIHDKIQYKIQEQLPRIRRRKIASVILWDGIIILIVAGISTLFGNKIMDHINRIKYSINQISGGNFSHKLQIQSNDEFGRLARDFNTVTEALWAKLESVQNILADVGESISNEIEIDKVEKSIVYLSLKSSDADGAGLYLFNEDKTALSLYYGVGDYRPPYFINGEKERVTPFNTSDDLIASFENYPIPLGETVIGEAAVKGEAIFIKRSTSSSFARSPDHPYYISSVIVIPIRVGNVVLGVLSLVKKGNDVFSDLEFANAQSFSELAAISIDNLIKYNEMLDVFELNREIDIAGEIQKNLLPQQIPDLKNTNMSFQTRTRRGINGDFYDCFMIDRERVLITLCEVAGKGVPAALVITMIKTILKLVSSSSKNASHIIEDLNKNITEKIRIENIASVAVIMYNQNTGEISYSSGGHLPLVVYRSSEDSFKEFRPRGIPVGLDKTAYYEETRIVLNDNDFLILFTDGIPEARNREGKEFTVDRLKEICRGKRTADSKTMVQEILDEMDYFHRNSQQWDDQTVFILKRGESHS
jgi:sigma-B regulation protein RsbU (phosphoserine phosphatase)